MTPSDEPRIDDAVDALSSLDNRTRLEILFALAEAERERGEQWLSLSFTELYDAVDLESSSRFSYHLDQLVGQFVAETADGYRLTYGGEKIVRMVLSGVYEGTRSFDEVPVDGVCIYCDTDSLVATVDEERFVVRCECCESTLLVDLLPLSQTRNRPPSAIVDSVGHRIWSTYTLVRGGVCPECYGAVDTAPDSSSHDGQTFHTLVHTCRECWLTITMPLEVSAAFHPAGVGFCWEHGISLPDVPLWEFFEFVVAGAITADIASHDPFEATFELSFDDETLRLEMDDSFRVAPVSSDD